MTPRVVTRAIIISWILSIALFINKFIFIDSSERKKVAVLGSCIPFGDINTEILLVSHSVSNQPGILGHLSDFDEICVCL